MTTLDDWTRLADEITPRTGDFHRRQVPGRGIRGDIRLGQPRHR